MRAGEQVAHLHCAWTASRLSNVIPLDPCGKRGQLLRVAHKLVGGTQHIFVCAANRLDGDKSDVLAAGWGQVDTEFVSLTK